MAFQELFLAIRCNLFIAFVIPSAVEGTFPKSNKKDFRFYPG